MSAAPLPRCGTYSQPYAPLPIPDGEADTDLMRRVRDGDSKAFALLVRRFERPLLHFFERFVHSRSLAEELSQDVFLRIYRARASYQPTAKFSTWLFRIATHVAINSLRDGKYDRLWHSFDHDVYSGPCLQVADRAPTAEARLLAAARAAEIRRAIDGLPSNQRSAVLLHKYHDLAYSDIARRLGCSEGAVKSLLFRAYERLRARLGHFSR